jgi:hypothetical protein
MNTPPTIFTQIMTFLPMSEFRKCVRRYSGEMYIPVNPATCSEGSRPRAHAG